MMEKPPQPEFEKEKKEEISKERVIEALRAEPTNLETLKNFLDEQEKLVKDSRGTLMLNITVAEIYRDAGLLDAARDAFKDAAEQAWQEGDDALCSRLTAEMENMDEGSS